MRGLAITLAVLACVLFAPGAAYAHGLKAEAHTAGGQVVLEVFFADGAAAVGAECVATLDGVEVARGKSDDSGVWTFRPAGPGRYRLSAVEVGLHRVRVVLTVSEADLAPVASGSVTPPRTPARLRQQSPMRDAVVGVLVVFLVCGVFAFFSRKSRDAS